MRKKPSKTVIIGALLAGTAVAGVWIHSHLFGWHHTWSKPETLSGGQAVSSAGRFVMQSCRAQTDRSVLPTEHDNAVFAVPDDFRVGTHPLGKVTVIPIGDFPISFTEPESSQFIGLHVQATFRFWQENRYWRASTCEFVIAYWLVALIPLAVLLSQVWRWFRCRATNSR